MLLYSDFRTTWTTYTLNSALHITRKKTERKGLFFHDMPLTKYNSRSTDFLCATWQHCQRHLLEHNLCLTLLKYSLWCSLHIGEIKIQIMAAGAGDKHHKREKLPWKSLCFWHSKLLRTRLLQHDFAETYRNNTGTCGLHIASKKNSLAASPPLDNRRTGKLLAPIHCAPLHRLRYQRTLFLQPTFF